jgi:hypothetical protein
MNATLTHSRRLQAAFEGSLRRIRPGLSLFTLLILFTNHDARGECKRHKSHPDNIIECSAASGSTVPLGAAHSYSSSHFI